MSDKTQLAMWALLMGLALPACKDKEDSGQDPEDTSPGTEDTDPGTEDSAADTGDSGDIFVPPCADGGWGFISEPESAIHVSAEGSAKGDGSMEEPLLDLEAALALTRKRKKDKRIAIWPGVYTGNLTLSHEEGDDDTAIQGCSADEVFIDAADEEESVVKVTEATGVVLEGVCSRGGTRSIQVWSAAQADLLNLRVEESIEAGLVIHGNSVVATIENVEVHSTVTTDDGFGYGIAFQEGATVTMSGGGAWDSTSVGLLIDDVSEVTLSEVTVDGTNQDGSGQYGRGLQIQEDAGPVSIADSTFSSNHGAGVFAMTALYLSMTGNLVDGTGASGIPDSSSGSGDGVVVTRGEGNLDPAYYVGMLDGNTVSGSDRAGIVLDGVTVEVSANTVSDSGYAIVSQGPADVSGSDTCTELTDEEALELNLLPLEAVDPGEH